MIDRNSQFMAILTNVGAAKLANANALGIPWNLTALGVGDANGIDPVPSATQTKLINEQRRAALNQLRVDPVNAAVIIAEQVIPADIGGWWIREIGLYDSDGDLVAVSNCAPSFKPALDQGSGRTQIVRMNFIVASTNSIVLKIDPAVVLATREYVDLAITEAINRQDFKHSVLVATTAAIALNGQQTIDGVPVVEGNRVLVKNQAQGKANGIYLVANGAWARTQDADSSVEVTPGLFVHVEKGTDNGDSVWQLVTDAPIVLGTTALVFEMVVGPTGVSAGGYTKVTVDKYGRVIAGANPNTLAAYGIETSTQVEAEAQSDHDNTKPMTALRVWQAFTKRLVQATETAFGWAKVATQSQTNSGVDDMSFITPKKFSAGLSALLVQATELLQGIAKVATQSQVEQGLDDTSIVTPKKLRKGFAISTGTNGYVVLPSWLGGLVLQWGSVAVGASSAAFTFPIEFPQALYTVSGSPVGTSASSGAGGGAISSGSRTGVTVYVWGTGNFLYRWIALGS